MITHRCETNIITERYYREIDVSFIPAARLITLAAYIHFSH